MDTSPLPKRRTHSLHSTAELVHTVADAFGKPVAEFSYFPTERVLYTNWYGHLSSEEVIRVAEASLPWIEQLHPLSLLNDKRGTSGDWGDAMMWIQYEWIPRAKAAGLTAFAYVLNADMQVSFENAALIEVIRKQVELRTFYSMPAAWKWLRKQAMRAALQAA